MKMSELLESKTKKGTYAGIKFNTESNKALHKYMRDNKIPNAIRPDKLHVTLLYSRKHCPNYEPMGTIEQPWNVVPGGFTVWQTNENSSKLANCLILKLNSQDLVDRHQHLMKQHDATFDYESYTPHVTLSYDIGDFDVDSLPPVSQSIKALVAASEYGEDLDLDWAMNKGGNK